MPTRTPVKFIYINSPQVISTLHLEDFDTVTPQQLNGNKVELGQNWSL